MTSSSSDKSKETKKFQKSYFDVVGLCCTSEVPLIEKILKPLDGIKQVSVIVPTKTVIVIHDSLLISQIQIVKALNQARLEANVRVYGEEKKGKKWPSLYTSGCGLLLLGSFFKHFFHPLKWLAVAAVVVGLPPILFRCVGAIRNFTLDINILVLIAVGGTIAMKDYWEAASIVFLFTIAEWLESRASHKATTVMSSLMSMAPQKAVLAENGHVVDAKDVEVNTILAVKAGEVIPIDGIVVDGKCEVDEKSLTGEPFPVTKQIQSKVLAGTINLNGYISVKTTALAEDCAVAKMAKLVEEAQNNKSQTQRFIDRCAQYYTPAVVFISISLAAIPAALRVHDLKHWIHLSLVVLVSACPCALILSTPVATFCALTKAATTGLLIKGGDYLEILAKIKIMAFDKTGTITRGEFSVTDFHSVSHDVGQNNLLYWVSSIESKSSHPMAAALVDYGRSNSIEPKPENVTEYQNFPGEGICGEIDGKKIYVGNRKMATRAGCEIVSNLGKEGDTMGYVFSGANQVGTFSVADTCRSGVAQAINHLKGLRIKTAMLTGDSRNAAMRVQDQLEQAIELVHADLLPQDKVRIINELKKDGPTAMIGDGVNDAPALATADIGISMGISGSALATETGHITLMSNDIGKIPQAIQLARKTRRKVVENVVLSIVTKAAILALAIAGHPLLWAAVLADVGTCLLVIFNSMLLLRGTMVTRSPHSAAKAGCEHPTHKGHCHDKGFSCGSKDLHNNLSTSTNLNPVKQKCCSHGDTQKTSTDQTRFDQTCASRPVHHHHHHEHSINSCQKKDSCRSNSKHHGHGGCNTNNTASSHVININKVETTGAKQCGHHSNHNGEHVECSKTDSSKESGVAVDNHSCGFHNSHNCSELLLGKYTNDIADSHEHSVSITCEANLLHKVSESSKKVVNNDVFNVNHSHEEEDYLGKTKHSGTTGCLHNEDGHFNCKNQASNVGKNCDDPTMNSLIGTNCNDEMVMHWCNSLEKREMDGCCKSFRKECGGNHHGCLGGGIGSLSEIITE